MSNTHDSPWRSAVDSLVHRIWSVCCLTSRPHGSGGERAMPRIVSIVRQSIGKLIPYSEWSDAFFFLFFFLFFLSIFLLFFCFFFLVARVFEKLPLFGVEYWHFGVEWSFEWSFSKSSGNVRMATQNSRYR